MSTSGFLADPQAHQRYRISSTEQEIGEQVMQPHPSLGIIFRMDQPSQLNVCQMQCLSSKTPNANKSVGSFLAGRRHRKLRWLF